MIGEIARQTSIRVAVAWLPRLTVACVTLLQGACDRPPVQMVLLTDREEVLDFTRRDEVMPAAPYFDADGELRWGGAELLWGIDRCPLGTLSRSGRILRGWPRIEQIDCHAEQDVMSPSQRWLIGFESDGSVSWQTSLVSGSGVQAYVQGVASWHSNQIILDSLAILDSRDGGVVGPAVSPLPSARFRFSGPVVWLHNEQNFLLYEPYGYQMIGAHSVLQLNPRSGSAHRVAEGAREWLWSRWLVTDMVVVGDSRWVIVAQELQWRGPHEVALAVLDRRHGRWIPLARPCASGNCTDARLAVASDGRVGFGFHDLARRKTVLLTYRFDILAAPSSEAAH